MARGRVRVLEFFSMLNRSFQGLLSFIRELGLRRQCPIEVVSLHWPGDDTIRPENKVEWHCATLCVHFIWSNQGYDQIWAYGHSHGGNVINIASQDVPFDKAFYFGTPVLEHTVQRCRPFNITRLFSFYSTLDPVQKAGSFDRRTWTTFFSRHSDGRTPAVHKMISTFQYTVACQRSRDRSFCTKDFLLIYGALSILLSVVMCIISILMQTFVQW